MRRLATIAVLAAAFLSGGWFFRRAPVTPQDAIHSLSRAGANVTIRHVPSAAADAAHCTAAELRDAGWTEAPVSTRTFHLLTRGEDLIALVAEDLPSGGSRVTTFHKRRALRQANNQRNRQQ